MTFNRHDSKTDRQQTDGLFTADLRLLLSKQLNEHFLIFLPVPNQCEWSERMGL